MPFFRTRVYRGVYSQVIEPVPFNEADLELRALLPPIERKMRGRPKKRRIPSRGEESQRKRPPYKCKRCGMVGHNKVTCKNPRPPERREEDAKRVR